MTLFAIILLALVNATSVVTGVLGFHATVEEQSLDAQKLVNEQNGIPWMGHCPGGK